MHSWHTESARPATAATAALVPAVAKADAAVRGSHTACDKTIFHVNTYHPVLQLLKAAILMRDRYKRHRQDAYSTQSNHRHVTTSRNKCKLCKRNKPALAWTARWRKCLELAKKQTHTMVPRVASRLSSCVASVAADNNCTMGTVHG